MCCVHHCLIQWYASYHGYPIKLFILVKYGGYLKLDFPVATVAVIPTILMRTDS
jgi:hypothetical protein